MLYYVYKSGTNEFVLSVDWEIKPGGLIKDFIINNVKFTKDFTKAKKFASFYLARDVMFEIGEATLESIN